MLNFDKFAKFVGLQLETGDYDAVIPFMLKLCLEQSLSKQQSVELGLLYMAYYNEACAWMHWQILGGLHSTALEQLPIETQRRNLYGGRLHQHLEALCEMNDEIPWSERLDACTTWAEAMNCVQSVYGNGRWAAFTGTELLLYLIDRQDLLPNTCEVLDSSGPLSGLHWLGVVPCEQTCIEVQEALKLEGHEVNSGQMESLLCDWASVCKGSLYAGRSIDRQQDRILRVERIIGQKLPELWEIRFLAYPVNTLGEMNGWVGIDRPRLKHYALTKQILAPWENRLQYATA